MAADSRPRKVVRVVEPQAVTEGAGVKLVRTIASRSLDYLDPFLLLDDFRSDNPQDYVAGFPWHPHRGIETVTYMLAGVVQHRDSLGNAGSIGAGANHPADLESTRRRAGNGPPVLLEVPGRQRPQRRRH